MPAPLVLPAPSPPAPTTTQGSTFSYFLDIADIVSGLEKTAYIYA